jgi:hypothetical protein
MTGPSDAEHLRQRDVRAAFRENGSGQWTVLYDEIEGGGRRIGLFSALATPELRAKVLERSSWDLSKGDGGPGFVQDHHEGREQTRYLPYGSDDGIEPLVLHRYFYSIRPSYNELVQEFRLFHNLSDAGDGRLLEIADDGTDILAAEVFPNRVRVLTRLLRRFQAARQMDVLLFIDSTEREGGKRHVDNEREEEREELLRATFYVGEIAGMPFSRYFGKRVLRAPSQSESGMWPFDEADTYFPDFIIGVDEHGEPIRHTCDPDSLSTYFDTNPVAPHYLTPVFFNREVLRKYYERPERYAVGDGSLSCRGLWSLRMDNDHFEHVMVFLGDLGRDLPSPSERDYWRSFNLLPASPQMSETAFRRNLLGQWAGAQSQDLTFRHRYQEFGERWSERFGWQLYRSPGAGDHHLLNAIRIPLGEGDAEFEGQLLNLARLLIDSLNDAELMKHITPPPTDKDVKSISKFEMWPEGLRL